MKDIFNYMMTTVIGFMSQLALMVLTCNLFYGMDLLVGVFLIQLVLGFYTIYNLMETLRGKIVKYLTEDSE